MRVLIVDDDKTSAPILCRLIRKTFGADCVIAESMKEALEKFERESFDFVALDACLTDCSAHETVEQIPRFTGATVHVFTGYDLGPEILHRVIELGATFSQKGMADGRLMERIGFALDRAHPSIETSRKVYDIHRSNVRSEKNWITRNLATLGGVFGMCVALIAIGGSVYGWVVEPAMTRQNVNVQFKDTAAAISAEILARSSADAALSQTLDRILIELKDLSNKSIISIQDRANLHAQIGGVGGQVKEMKDDITRRMDRSEDNQNALMRAFKISPAPRE